MNEQIAQNRRRLGAKIRDLRDAQNLSLRKFASMINMDYSHICNIENGKESPTLDTLTKIAEGLDVDISELFSGSRSIEYAMLDDER